MNWGRLETVMSDYGSEFRSRESGQTVSDLGAGQSIRQSR